MNFFSRFNFSTLVFKKWIIRIVILFVLFNIFQLLYYKGKLQKVDGAFAKINSLTGGLINLEKFMNTVDYYRPLMRCFHPIKDKMVIDISRNDYAYFIDFIHKSQMKGYYSDELKKSRRAKIIKGKDSIPVKLKIQGTNVYGAEIIPFKVKYIGLGDSVRFNLMLKNTDPTELLPNWIAKQSGLFAPKQDFKYVNLKGHYTYYYVYEEEVSKMTIEREYSVTNYTILKNNDDWNRKDKWTGNQHSSELDDYFGNVEVKEATSLRPDIALGKYNEMVSFLKNNDMKSLSDLFDKEYMGKFFAIFSLFNDPHFVTGDNFKLLYNHSNGHFYPIYRQEHGFRFANSSSWPRFNSIAFETMDNTNLGYEHSFSIRLLKALISDDKIRNYRDQYLWNLVKNKNTFMSAIDKFYDAHNNAIYYSSVPRRVLDRNKRFQKLIINNALVDFSKYIKYSKLYLTSIVGKDTLIVMNESFAPVNLYYKKNKFVKIKLDIPPLAFTEKLEFSYRTSQYCINDSVIKKENILAFNAVTGDTIPILDIYFNAITFMEPFDDFYKVLKRNKFNYSLEKDTLSIWGNNILKENLVLPKGIHLKLLPATKMQFGNKISMLVKGGIYADGAKPGIIIENLPNERFGTFAVVGNQSKEKTKMVLTNFSIKGGQESIINGIYFSTQFGLYNGDITLNNVSVSDSKADDGINIKNSTVDIKNLIVFANYADQVDLDFCIGTISDSHFKSGREDSNGDGLDMSGSKVIIENSSFSSFLDKGISVGEKSTTLVRNCVFKKNIRAIAIKDNSNAFVKNNTYQDNDTNFVMYIKKTIFQKPVLHGMNNEIPKVYIRQGQAIKYTDAAKFDSDIKVIFGNN